MKWINIISKIFKRTIQGIVILCITFLLFDIFYRNSVIDFYKSELKSLNTEVEINSSNIDYLVFGDSFTAWEDNFVSRLKAQYPEKSFLNLSISGIGIKEVNTFAEKRIKKYKPKNIIYQIYVGNDLLDVRHLQNWKDLSLARSLYWKTTDYLPSIIYLNKKLRSLKSSKNFIASERQDVFDSNFYNDRDKLLLKGDKEYIFESITLANDFNERYNIWHNELNNFFEIIPDNTNVFIVFLPHCAQINDYYYDNMETLGAIFDDKELTQNNNYNFFNTALIDFKGFRNVAFLNPLDYIRANDNEDFRLYFKNDSHFNANGQRIITQYLKEQIFSK